MIVSSKKHKEAVSKLSTEISVLKEDVTFYKSRMIELEKTLKDKIEISYKYNFPQKPTVIIVSSYVAEKFLHNKTKFVPKYPFPDYEYEGLPIRVDEKLSKYEVLFKAKWEEPPVVCKNCGEKRKFEYAYPKENPVFCSQICFERFLKQSQAK